MRTDEKRKKEGPAGVSGMLNTKTKEDGSEQKKRTSLIKWSTPSIDECGEEYLKFAIGHEFITPNLLLTCTMKKTIKKIRSTVAGSKNWKKIEKKLKKNWKNWKKKNFNQKIDKVPDSRLMKNFFIKASIDIGKKVISVILSIFH